MTSTSPRFTAAKISGQAVLIDNNGEGWYAIHGAGPDNVKDAVRAAKKANDGDYTSVVHGKTRDSRIWYPLPDKKFIEELSPEERLPDKIRLVNTYHDEAIIRRTPDGGACLDVGWIMFNIAPNELKELIEYLSD